MGALRSIGLILIAILFFIGVLATSSLWVIVSSLSYENLKASVEDVVKEVVQEELGEEKISEILKDEKANEEVISMLDENYYKEYGCDFWSCLKESGPTYLASEEARDYGKGKFYLALGLTILFFILMSLLVEKKSNSFILGGILMIVSAFPLLLLDKILFGFLGEILSFVSFIFSNAYWTAIKVIAFGVVMLVFGVAWRVFNIGVWVSEKFGKSEVVEDRSGKKK